MNNDDLNGQTVSVQWVQWLEERTQLAQWRGSDSARYLTVTVRTDLPVDHLELQTLTTADKIIIEVDSFTDGRIFGLARLFRQKLEFTGTLEVKGDYLPDQVSFMKRCGIDSFVEPSLAAADEYYSGFYQPPHSGGEKHVDIRRVRLQYGFIEEGR